MTIFRLTDKFIISGIQIGMIQSELYGITNNENEGEVSAIFDIFTTIVDKGPVVNK